MYVSTAVALVWTTDDRIGGPLLKEVLYGIRLIIKYN